MKPTPTITIGIPALNEEANIGSLLKKLISQDTSNYELDKIIVVSDASTDQTDNIVAKLSEEHPKIQLIRNNTRQGCQFSQNLVFQMSDTDIVVLIDADHLPKDNHTIAHLIKPIITKKTVSLVGGNIQPTKATSFLQTVLNFSIVRNRLMFENIKQQYIIQHLISSFIAHPLLMSSYLTLLLYMRIRAAVLPSKTNGLWELVTSSKNKISGETII